MTMNRIGNLMIFVFQLIEMNILIVNYFLFGHCIVMSRF